MSDIKIDVQLNAQRALRSLNQIETRLKSLNLTNALNPATLNKGLTQTARSVNNISRASERMARNFNAAFNVALVVGFANAVAKAGDQITNISNSLRAVGVDSQQLGRQLTFVVRTAQSARVGSQKENNWDEEWRRATEGIGRKTSLQPSYKW